MIDDPLAIARRRVGRIAVGYALVTTVLLVVNAVTHGPSWWYFAAAGVGTAIGMQLLRLRRVGEGLDARRRPR